MENKILIIGNGGRECAIAKTIRKFHPEMKIFLAPGNGGTENEFNNIAIDVKNLDALLNFAKEEKITLTIVGPEVPLVLGIVDLFEENGLRIFGPNKVCAQFEGSKRFTKEFLEKYNIPTAAYKTFSKDEKAYALRAIREFSLPMVVKADGLAAGKGVLICESYEEAEIAIKDIFSDKFKGAGSTIVIEEYLTGTEASLLCFVDGKTIVPMETARDYKRALDGDKGLNTGGMGGFSPNTIIDARLKETIEKTILEPIMYGFKTEGLVFKGVLFIGLMIENDSAKVLEFNVRFGDPETQSILPRLLTDLVAIFEHCIDGTLEGIPIDWHHEITATVVIASEGYPETVHNGDVISGIDTLLEDTYLCYAGTKKQGDNLVTAGGRVLTLTCMGETLKEARNKVYEETKKINFQGMQYRKDIGKSCFTTN